MACRRGSVAPASARRCTIQLSRLQLALHNLPHSSKHVDVLELMMGRSMLDGQLPSGLSAWAVPLARAGTSSRVAGVAGRVGSVGVSLGRVPRCHGGPSRAGCGGGAFATRARYMGGGMGRSSPSVAFMRHWAADHWSYGSTGFWRQIGSSAQDDMHMGAGARRGARLRDLAYGVSKLFSQPCVRLVALRVLWTARAARRPFLFWIGRRARSGCAGPPGPRPLAPPRMRPSESEWDDGGPAGMLGGGARGGGAGQRAERGGKQRTTGEGGGSGIRAGGGADGEDRLTRSGVAAVNYDGRVASCRTAGLTDHACGPEAFPFWDRPTGEVGARGAFGPSPPRTSEVAHPSKGERDDGGLAGTYGASARKPSAPGTYGGLVWNNPAGRGSTRGEDSTGRDEDAARRAARAARFAADRPVQRVGTGAGGPAGGGVNQRTETVQAEAGSGGAGVARAGGMDEVDAGRRGGGGASCGSGWRGSN